MPATTQLFDRIRQRVRAGAKVIVVQDADEALALAHCMPVAESRKPIAIHSPTTCFCPTPCDRDAGSRLGAHPKSPGTLILLGFLGVYSDPMAARQIREVDLQQRPEGEQDSLLILIELPTTVIPPGIVGNADVLTPTLPGIPELTDELESFVTTKGIELTGNGQTKYTLAASVAGLPRHEAAKLFALSVVENDRLDAAWLRAEKAKRVSVRLGGALTFEKTDAPAVGGLDNLRAWLKLKRGTFDSVKARDRHIPSPKGLMLVGTPGSGKSLVAKTVANSWGLPLLRLDVGRLFGSYIGQSEGQARAAIEAVEACAPCVLMVDEIDKGLSSGGGGDSGTSDRVVGTLLSWLQDKTAAVFVIATANNIGAMLATKPELFRKGRFDELFFVGLPSLEERIEIIKIHLDRRERTLKPVEIMDVAKATDRFSGAEIEQAIIEGMFTAYADDDRDLTVADVLDAVTVTRPLSKTAPEKITAIETWGMANARPASSPKAAPLATTGGRRINVGAK